MPNKLPFVATYSVPMILVGMVWSPIKSAQAYPGDVTRSSANVMAIGLVDVTLDPPKCSAAACEVAMAA